MKEKCTHSNSLFYFPHINEAGWKCADCGFQPGEPPGFSPQTDREEIWTKVYCLLNDFSNADLINISNGSEGDYLTAIVADKCKHADRYDQYTILRFILEEIQPGHADFWENISKGILAGKDPRDRCACGELATGRTHKNGKRVDYCSKHRDYGDIIANEPDSTEPQSIDEPAQAEH